MKRYFTNRRIGDVHLGQVDTDKNEQPIFLGSPILGYPSLYERDGPEVPVNKILLLDVNILDCIRKRKNQVNLNALFAWSAAMKVELTPIVAVAEQHRTHAKPEAAFEDYVKALREDYSYALPDSEVQRLLAVFKNTSPGIEQNVGLFRDYLVVIKHVYNKRGSLEEKIKRLTSIIDDSNIPVFAFAVLLAGVYFHVQANPGAYTKRVVKKVQSDMAISPSKEESRLWNAASDLAFLNAASEIFFNKETGEHNLAFVASTDITVGLALSELCYPQIVVNEGACFGHVGFRVDSISGDTLNPLISKHLKQRKHQNFVPAGPNNDRRKNLSELAHELGGG